METGLATLVEVNPRFIPDIWESVRDLVHEACSRSGGRYTLMDILNLLMAQKMQLWVITKDGMVKGVALSEIRNYPQAKECLTFAATGEDYQLWVHLIEEVEKWGKERGCHISTCCTRPGWEKPLKKFGYEKTHVYLEKVIGNVH